MNKKFIECGSHRLSLDGTLVMGILNVTPDSFYDGGTYSNTGDVLERARRMVADGVDILDVGGESTRPGSEPVSIEDEIGRVVPVIGALACELDVPVSADSYKPEVVSKAIEAGASMVNDVYGLRSEGMAELVAESGLPVVIMHMQGTPKSMQDDPVYRDVVGDIKEFFRERIEYAKSRGVKDGQIILDPGIGFGKNLEHNLEIIRRFIEFKELGYPLLVGASRKSMIGQILDAPPEKRLSGSIAVAVASIMNGADILRVHDVAETVQAARVTDAVLLTGRLRRQPP
ncbi:MAG: dihydropteroate synthase [Candidatus Altiarchaeota archaeon]